MAKKSRTGDTAEDFSPRPVPRPTRAPEESMRPATRPAGLEERAELRKAKDSADAAYRASRLEAEDMDMLGFADGGMVRGCKSGQMTGKKFSGTF